MWRRIAQQAVASRDESLEAATPSILAPCEREQAESPSLLARSRLTEREIHLTEDYPVMQLLNKLRRREISSEEVVRAFMRRAVVAQHVTNCLTELMWDEAITRARYLDSLPAPMGPLHGLPISIKENQGMQGTGKTCNVGNVSWVGDACTSDFHLHNILLDAGCIFYARTTLPQSVMQLETNSNIYGRTTNPYNRKHTSGGSSGGEGALIAMRGSVLGIGGDIGGSIRVPAAFNGIYGFKPTSSRFPGADSRAPMAGSDAIHGANGPMAADRDGLELLMKIVLDAKPWRQDPSVTPQPWTPYTFKRPPSIGIQMSDGIVSPHPPVTRALREVAAACRKAGMQVVDWASLDHDRAWDITSGLYFPDGGKDVLNVLAEVQEPVLPLTHFIIKEQPNVKDRNLAELWQICRQRNKFRVHYARHWENAATDGGREVDVILDPAYPGAAPPHDCARYWPYTSTWNLLDYPAAVFPVTVVSSNDEKDRSYVPKNAQDQYNYDLYDKNSYMGLPISLQIIGRRGHDEMVIAALAEIEKAMVACERV